MNRDTREKTTLGKGLGDFVPDGDKTGVKHEYGDKWGQIWRDYDHPIQGAIMRFCPRPGTNLVSGDKLKMAGNPL